MFRALVVIDPQNDFCKPEIRKEIQSPDDDPVIEVSPAGSLFVPGADKDMERLAAFLMERATDIHDVYITLDSHKRLDIAHPMWWMDKEGAMPEPLTVITHADVVAGKWMAQIPDYQIWSEYYLKTLEAQGNYPHVIWPYHCIDGTEGAAIVPVLVDALKEWEETMFNSPENVRKGQNPLTEHYSAVKAEVVTDDPETGVNENFVKELTIYDEILVAGEAMSHCLANTVRDLVKNGIDPKKVIVLTDCTSNVPTFEELGAAFQREMETLDMRFMTTEEFNG